jgi:hypothetical protein
MLKSGIKFILDVWDITKTDHRGQPTRLADRLLFAGIMYSVLLFFVYATFCGIVAELR